MSSKVHEKPWPAGLLAMALVRLQRPVSWAVTALSGSRSRRNQETTLRNWIPVAGNARMLINRPGPPASAMQPRPR